MSYVIYEKRKRQWEMERRVPLALLLTLFLQIGAVIIWAAQLDTRVGRIEKDIEYMRNRIDEIVIARSAATRQSSSSMRNALDRRATLAMTDVQ